MNDGITAKDRYKRLLNGLKKVIPYDVAAILRLEGDALIPLATQGMSSDAMGRRFLLNEHPRLKIICKSEIPVNFPADSDLPDPFDGLISETSNKFQKIHACLGCPLIIDRDLIGVLTTDACQANLYDNISTEFLSGLSAVVAASLRTTNLIEALEISANRQGLIAQELMRDLQLRRGSNLIGVSPAMNHLRDEIGIVSRSELTVLIMGETGVGKVLVARAFS